MGNILFDSLCSYFFWFINFWKIRKKNPETNEKEIKGGEKRRENKIKEKEMRRLQSFIYFYANIPVGWGCGL